MTLTDSQAWCLIIAGVGGAASGLVSVLGHVLVLTIRELRRRPETIPPVPPPGTRSTTVTQTPPITQTPGKPAAVPVPPKGPNTL